jgi:hypothetical protein
MEPGMAGTTDAKVPAPRSRLVVIVAAAVALALLAVGLGAALLWHRRSGPAAVAGSAAPVQPVAERALPSPGAAALTGPACVVGRWREVSDQADVTVFGVAVRITSSGTTQTFTADGKATIGLNPPVTSTGTHSGDTYAVTSTGTITFHYQIIGNQIFYSDAGAQGTTVWKRNGQQIESQQLKGSLGPDTFSCTGDSFFQYGPYYSIELKRIPG